MCRIQTSTINTEVNLSISLHFQMYCVYGVCLQKLPPVRNSLVVKKKKKKKEQVEKLSTKPTKIRGYDYRAWDKFDVVSDDTVALFLTY